MNRALIFSKLYPTQNNSISIPKKKELVMQLCFIEIVDSGILRL